MPQETQQQDRSCPILAHLDLFQQAAVTPSLMTQTQLPHLNPCSDSQSNLCDQSQVLHHRRVKNVTTELPKPNIQ